MSDITRDVVWEKVQASLSKTDSGVTAWMSVPVFDDRYVMLIRISKDELPYTPHILDRMVEMIDGQILDLMIHGL